MIGLRSLRPLQKILLCGIPLVIVTVVLAAVITENDSTQPRGTPLFNKNNQRGQLLDPIEDGFRSAAFRGQEQDEIYENWAGMMMANAMRDPAFFAQLSVANADVIKLINSLPGEPDDPATELGEFLAANNLNQDIFRDPATGLLEPEELLPFTADLCIRCHSPVGWLEGRSEPPTIESPHLRGQFWGAALLETPVDANGNPRRADLTMESEADMDGLQCDFCHRAKDNFKRFSRYDGSEMANGSGGYFVSIFDPFGDDEVEPEFDFQEEGVFCGTCHDVTNPIIKTQTVVNGQIPDMLHPIERTYTEWFWSDFREEQSCQDCHEPMKFLGAQTWLIYPGFHMLWGDVDQKWRDPPFNYDVPLRQVAWEKGMERNRCFMAEEAASVEIVDTPSAAVPGDEVTVNVKITNHAGHKLPTGYAEGRQMWIHIRAVDALGIVLFEDGILGADGALIRTPESKVYEHIALAQGFPFLDEDGSGEVEHHEQEFHFILLNFIEKDNRIPPKGFNKAAYTADGAFIIPRDPKDTDYPDGQNWDITPYTFTIPFNSLGPVEVTARLRYQTFNREYMEFLRDHDVEPTESLGGRARDLPADGQYADLTTWGEALFQIWEDTGQGPPVEMGQAQVTISVKGNNCPWDCGDNDGIVGIVDFLAVLAQWGSPGSCDFDGGGVGINDFLELLANWGPCP